jgi:hypothetical protein
MRAKNLSTMSKSRLAALRAAKSGEVARLDQVQVGCFAFRIFFIAMVPSWFPRWGFLFLFCAHLFCFEHPD